MRRILRIGAALVIPAAALFWYLTQPAPLIGDYDRTHTPDPAAGALVFAAAGCASCHVAPDAAGGDLPVLSGGKAFASDFGTFYAPNISPDPTHGIGTWQVAELARAVTKGGSPTGQHYYPAFPYAAYQHMTDADLVNLHAYMQTLPPSDQASRAHDVGFPFNIRRGLGLWKLAFVQQDYVQPAEDAVMQRGRYLVEGLAHCAECHTPRNALGGLQHDRWMAGAPNPSGKGQIPNITPAELDWSTADLVEYFTSGFTPEYDTAGGSMAEVVENLAQLPLSDREAIAAYIKALPAVPSL